MQQAGVVSQETVKTLASSGQIIPVPVVLDTSNNGHKYKFTGAHAKEWEKEWNNVPILSVTQMGTLLTGGMPTDEKTQQRLKTAADFGTKFHKVIEEIEKNNTKDVNDDYLKSLGVNAKDIKKMQTMVDGYFKMKKDKGFNDTAVGSEMSLGGIVQTSNGPRMIAGTLDQLYYSLM